MLTHTRKSHKTSVLSVHLPCGGSRSAQHGLLPAVQQAPGSVTEAGWGPQIWWGDHLWLALVNPGPSLDSAKVLRLPWESQLSTSLSEWGSGPRGSSQIFSILQRQLGAGWCSQKLETQCPSVTPFPEPAQPPVLQGSEEPCRPPRAPPEQPVNLPRSHSLQTKPIWCHSPQSPSLGWSAWGLGPGCLGLSLHHPCPPTISYPSHPLHLSSPPPSPLPGAAFPAFSGWMVHGCGSVKDSTWHWVITAWQAVCTDQLSWFSRPHEVDALISPTVQMRRLRPRALCQLPTRCQSHTFHWRLEPRPHELHPRLSDWGLWHQTGPVCKLCDLRKSTLSLKSVSSSVKSECWSCLGLWKG